MKEKYVRLVRRRGRLIWGLLTLVAAGGTASALGHEWVTELLGLALVAALILLVADTRERTTEQARQAATLAKDLASARRTLKTIGKRNRRTAAAVTSMRRTLGQARPHARSTKANLDDTARKLLAAIETERSIADSRHQELLDMAGMTQPPSAPPNEIATYAALVQYIDQLEPRALLPSQLNGMAADARDLAHLVDLARLVKPRTVLELGSGTTTVWLAYALERLGSESFVSLHHSQPELDSVGAELARHGLSSVVDLRLAPLEPGSPDSSATPWYDQAAVKEPETIDLLLIAGPPSSVAPYSRRPALPLLYPRLSSRAVVVLARSASDGGQDVGEEWIQEFGLNVIDSGVSSLLVLTKTR